VAQKNKTTSSVEYLLVQVFSFIVVNLPYTMALSLGSALGTVVYKLWGNRNRLTQDNLALVFSDKKPAELRRMGKAVFQNIGKTLVEFIYTNNWDRSKLLARVEVQGRENLTAALGKGKGVILLAAHFGNWELLGLALSALGYKVNVVARPLDNPRLDQLVNRIRSRFGEQIIANIDGIKDVIKCLRRNEIVGILMDQNLYENAVFVEFFGKLAATTPIIPLLAQKNSAAVIPIHMVRLNNGNHRIIIEKELEMWELSSRQEYINDNTRLCNQVIERWIKQTPEQWFWVHNRWKTRPDKNL
jgi:Kdo2-lipid IVA lauroyltransferase/acyltransferase